jgi:broad specificity phosphatase PhoE
MLTPEMTNQQIAIERFMAYDREMATFTFGDWATMTDVVARNEREQEIKDRHGIRHGWIVVNGESFNRERAFPDQFFPRFPDDQGLSD